MSIDIQVLSSTLLNFIQAQMQDSFNTTCLPSFGSNYIDHVDVTGATPAIVPAGAEFTLPVDVYAVDMAMLRRASMARLPAPRLRRDRRVSFSR